MKIKVKVLTKGCMPTIIDKGDWIDLICAEDTMLQAPKTGDYTIKTNEHGVNKIVKNIEAEVTYIPLGIAMELPKGFEAILLPRSSTPKKLGVICANSMGVIDHSFMGDNDQWCFPAVPIRSTFIEKGTRLCQFRIQLSQKASVWQKIKWLFSNKITLVEVDSLGNKDRQGLGSTGIK